MILWKKRLKERCSSGVQLGAGRGCGFLKLSETSVTSCRSYSGPAGQLWTQLDLLAVFGRGLGYLTQKSETLWLQLIATISSNRPTRSALGQIEFIPSLWNCVWQCWLFIIRSWLKQVFEFHFSFPSWWKCYRLFQYPRYMRIKINSSDGSQN